VEDVAQQVWASVWRRIGELREARRWRPWLYRIARNAALDAGRELSRRGGIAGAGNPELPLGAPPSPPQVLMADEQRHAVMEAIRSLPTIYREPFVLRHLQDWSYRSIAETMGIPADTVETRLVRARRLLRQSLAGKV
jgi:RNA polymerase sigma-70 factor (ECF subfamily)